MGVVHYMNPDPVSSRVRENLRQHVDSLQLLLELLQQEQAALPGEDVSALERITQSKAAAAEHLHELGRELLPLQATAMAATQEWAEVQSLAARCQAANAENASLLDIRARTVRTRLQILRGGQGPSLYDRSGASSALGSRRLGLA